MANREKSIPALRQATVHRIYIINHKVIFTTLCYLLFTYTTSFSQDSFWYKFRGTAKLEINYTNNPGKQAWSVFTYKMLPEQDITISDTIPAGSGKRKYELPLSWPQKATLTVSGKEMTLLLTPGSTLICNLDFKDLTKVSFEAPDSLAAINEYLLHKDLSAEVSFKRRRSIAVQQAATLQEFSNKMNNLYVEEQQFFNENRSKLPHWYQSYEYWENRYADALLRLNTVPQREYSTKVKETIPLTYYGFLDSLAINNDAAKGFYSYYLFLYELYNRRMKDYDLSHGTNSVFLDYHISQANNDLTGEALDLFKAFIIQLVHNYYKKDVALNYIKDNNSVFANKVWVNELNSYFQKKDTYVAKGKIPPNFVLADLKDSLTSLRSFKGNVIVLSFWFAGCKPCIEEFSAENALAEKFKNKPVRIVSVCVNTSEDTWKLWSKRFGLKTINLWANSQWEKTIIEKYDLTVFPKYVLIDQDHKIAETNADRPSDGLEMQINSLLGM